MASIGEIRMFAGSFVPTGWLKCDGSTLTISEYQDLYEVVGKTYGGDGSTTFGLPNLTTNTPLHRSPQIPLGKAGSGALSLEAPSAPILHVITPSVPPSDFTPWVGEIRTFAFGAMPKGWALCDGSLLDASANEALFALLGNTYGGNSNEGTFALPDLRGTPVKATSGNDPLGYVVLSYCIATQGVFPEKG